MPCQVSEIQQLLHDGGIDFRDCYEKGELIRRLQETEARLPPSVRSRLRAALAGPMAGPSVEQPPSAAAGMTDAGVSHPQSQLFMDEQYVVNLFNVSVCLAVGLNHVRAHKYYRGSMQ